MDQHAPHGRRERKKAELRTRISEVATALFLERGFDDVSVSEIAEAADVARPTVFAHFARKEDLLFDRYPEAEALVVAAVNDRPAGTSAVVALSELLVTLADQGHPL
ncbi:MAG TPA: helix-turn-helix domain-containing protein, partial [Kribbella sp.]|nr:helix-turn-helix domain-containing protein [Kribbella sp.]